MAKTPIPATSPLKSRRPLKEQYKALIALPCCNELARLPETLHSLEATAAQLYDDTLIIVNVNQRASMDRCENLATLEWLRQFETPLQLAWLDHVSGDAAYPEKFGVGLARHQACSSGATVGRQRGALDQSRRRQSRPSGVSTGYFFLLA